MIFFRIFAIILRLHPEKENFLETIALNVIAALIAYCFAGFNVAAHNRRDRTNRHWMIVGWLGIITFIGVLPAIVGGWVISYVFEVSLIGHLSDYVLYGTCLVEILAFLSLIVF